MVFSQIAFLYFFLPCMMLLYFAAGIVRSSDAGLRIRNIIILITGLIFYAWGEPFYVVIMLISTLIDFFAGRYMDKHDGDDKKRRKALIVSVCMNIGLLAVFKYSDFLTDSINAMAGSDITNPVLYIARGLNRIAPFGLDEHKVRLPIGISFYTFQSMSYTIDLYMRRIKVQKSPLRFAAYVTLFPQIVAGPIVRYEEVEKELEHRSVTAERISSGIGMFVKGLCKKVLLANNIGALWAEIKAQDYAAMPALTAWLGILAFTFQIYFDFSGYSDMAVGLGRMMGFEFPKNFDHPYISKSVSEFWRRWHITLGSWFRSYVYIPLGGNRKGLPRTLLNLLIVWALTGLWHGASWNFVLWGLYFGLLIIMEKLFLGKLLEKLPKPVSIGYTFLMAVFGWVLFDTDSLDGAAKYLGAMFGAGGRFADSVSLYHLSCYAAIFAICAFVASGIFTRLVSAADNFIKNKADTFPDSAGRAAVIISRQLILTILQISAVAVCTMYLLSSAYNPFLYFRF
ncbi:MAG: MBOAT family protein [Oscillospiraceae bacterium]|nr:MBOAT family protein [Oscillospiraceae bacterium]